MATTPMQLLVACSVAVFLTLPELAQQSETTEPPAQDTESSRPCSQSGYDDIAEFGGDEVCFELAACRDD